MLLMIMNTTLYVRNRVRMRKKLVSIFIQCIIRNIWYLMWIYIWQAIRYPNFSQSVIQTMICSGLDINFINIQSQNVSSWVSEQEISDEYCFRDNYESLQPDTITLNTKFNLNDWTMAKASVKYWRIYGAYVILINPIVVVSDTHWKNPN